MSDPTDDEVIDALIIGGLICGMTNQMMPADEARERAEQVLATAKAHQGGGEGIVGLAAEWRWSLAGGMSELRRRGWTVRAAGG